MHCVQYDTQASPDYSGGLLLKDAGLEASYFKYFFNIAVRGLPIDLEGGPLFVPCR